MFTLYTSHMFIPCVSWDFHCIYCAVYPNQTKKKCTSVHTHTHTHTHTPPTPPPTPTPAATPTPAPTLQSPLGHDSGWPQTPAQTNCRPGEVRDDPLTHVVTVRKSRSRSGGISSSMDCAIFNCSQFALSVVINFFLNVPSLAVRLRETKLTHFELTARSPFTVTPE